MLKLLARAAGKALYILFILIIVLAVAAKNILVETAKGIAAGARKSWPEIKRIVMRDPTRPITVQFQAVE